LQDKGKKCLLFLTLYLLVINQILRKRIKNRYYCYHNNISALS
jgi:hypothetical protein